MKQLISYKKQNNIVAILFAFMLVSLITSITVVFLICTLLLQNQ
ncbi:MAG TPA: hypothetical protein VFT06_07140 [Flavisolibacter sp.]|nr:hypothetical protein [Flavisolibacter sp.]